MERLIVLLSSIIVVLILVGGCKLTGLNVKVDDLDTNEVVESK